MGRIPHRHGKCGPIGPFIARKRKTGAFTLIELLVVIAIIALLVSLLTPVLARVKEITRQVTCLSNLRQTGTAMHGFAAEREGRFPGKAHSTVEYWSPIWAQILNREYYHNNDQSVYPTSAYGDEPTCGPLLRFWTFWHPDYYDSSQLNKKWMTCTSFKAYSQSGSTNIWCRPWMMNRIANGGINWGTYDSLQGQYGKLIPNPQSIHRNYDEYALGTRVDLFVNTSYKFLVWEGERGSDITHLGSDTANGGRLRLGDEYPTRPPYTAYSGYFAFRHMLPPDRALYQQSARANVLYVDGHAAMINPNDPIGLAKHFLHDR